MQAPQDFLHVKKAYEVLSNPQQKSTYDARLPPVVTLVNVTLLTDGHTYGDEAQCLSLAKIAQEQGIGFSGLGVRSEWNDAFMRIASLIVLKGNLG